MEELCDADNVPDAFDTDNNPQIFKPHTACHMLSHEKTNWCTFLPQILIKPVCQKIPCFD
jgi:hypothetical protein